MTNHVLFEIGVEELPARFIDEAEQQLFNKTTDWLKELRIPYDSIQTFSTPRRLAVQIQGVSETQTTVKEEARGPSEQIAKDSDGNWTKAAVGFTKGQGKTTDDIYTKEQKGSTYIFVEKHIEGKPIFQLLPTFQEIIKSIPFQQNMRWADQTLRYARPIRWLVAMYNNEIVPFEIADIKSGNLTYGHRFLGKDINLNNPLEYQEKLKENFVIVDKGERQQFILSGIRQLEDNEQFHVVKDEELLSEVCNLVEYPTVFHGEFETSFLNLPPEVLITSMKEHQRYFSVQSNNGDLLPYFISVRNGNDNEISTVIRGNEKVLHARLSDAQFFYEEDQKQSLDFHRKKLERVVFQEKLGSISDKVARVTKNTKDIAAKLNMEKETTKQSIRTAEISKFDLMTNMVHEFTELQGIMGEKYALLYGEDKIVAQAIREHYLPKQANGKLPESAPGAIVSLADKLDTIIGFISVDLTPTGSQDPYSLRRQAIGVLRILEDRQWDITFESLLAIAMQQYKLVVNDSIAEKIHSFFTLRMTYLLKQKSIEQDVIEAVLQKEIGNVSYVTEKALVLSAKRNDPDFKHIQEALVRVLNLANAAAPTDVDESLFKTPSESQLHDKYLEVRQKYGQVRKQKQAKQALSELAKLAEPIHSFLENNMVMTDHHAIKNNRLSLINHLASLINDYADLTIIQWKQHT